MLSKVLFDHAINNSSYYLISILILNWWIFMNKCIQVVWPYLWKTQFDYSTLENYHGLGYQLMVGGAFSQTVIHRNYTFLILTRFGADELEY